jgi:Mg/Co/Ni transporter MgtE
MSIRSAIDEALHKRDLVALREALRHWALSEVVRVIEPLSTEEQAIVHRILLRELAAEAFECVDVCTQQRLFESAGTRGTGRAPQ